MSVNVLAVNHPEVPPFKMPDRFRHEIAYFGSRNGPNIPVELGPSEYWIDRDEAQEAYDSGVIRLVSPLDSSSTAELELTEEQERWLEWVLEHDVQHVRLES
jgi:hypothetical protein